MMSSFFSLSTLTRLRHLTGVPPGPWKRSLFRFLTALRPHGILFVSGADMNLYSISLAAVLTGVAGAATLAQTTQDSVPARKAEAPTTIQEQFVLPNSVIPKKDSVRAEAYYNYTMGHIYEQQYEATSRRSTPRRRLRRTKRRMRWIRNLRSSASGWRRCIGRRNASERPWQKRKRS